MTDETEPHTTALADFDDALARAFANIEAAKKDSENPHFRTKYADLASVTDAIRGPLTSEGFSWPQGTSMSEDGRTVIVTTELRRKGLVIRSVLAVPVEKPTAQGVGSAITYARRYALSAITGVCPDDDDGHAASASGKSKQPSKAKPKTNVASPEWKAAYKKYQAVAKRRADALHTTGLPGYMTPAERVASALGVKTAPAGRDITPEQWQAITLVFASDVTDIEERMDRDADNQPTGEP